jgi:predicted RNase H-like HicB family nuclease
VSGGSVALYKVCLEIAKDGTCMAHVPELAGCFAVGSTREEALERLRRAITEYLTWLAALGETGAPSAETAEVEVEVAEEVSTDGSYPRQPGEPLAFFTADEEPLSHHDLQTAMRLMERARRDLLEFLRDVPNEILQWRPGPHEWSVAETLLHMAQAEASYIARLEEQSEPTPFPQLAAIRSWAYHRLGRLTDPELSRVTVHRGERWSARKVLRRFLEHDRAHTAYIRGLLARYRRDSSAK